MTSTATTVEDLTTSDPAFWVRLTSPFICPSSTSFAIPCADPVPYALPFVNPYELERVLPLNAITPTSKFRTLPYFDRISYLVAAGAMQGGAAIELTINLKDITAGDKADEELRSLLRKLLRVLKATGWPGRHMWVEVKRHTKTSKKTGKTKTMQHHVHLILFNAGPGTRAYEAMQEFQLTRNIEKVRSCSIRVKSLAEIRSYVFKNKHWDRGSIGADKATTREAHAMAKLPALDLWKVWLDAAPAELGVLPEAPPILADRAAVETATADTRRKTQKARAKRAFEKDARKRARIASGDPEVVPASPLPPDAASALLGVWERDLESLAVEAVEEGAFDLLDLTPEPVGSLQPPGCG